jgi:hypothetical protein
MRRAPTALTRGLLIVGALIAATTGLTATKAAFTDAVPAVDWTITTGSIALERDGDGLVFSSAPLAPGDSATGTVVVRNVGDNLFKLSLGREGIESTAPAGCAVRDALHLKIVDGATTLVDAPLPTAATSVDVGDLAPAASRTLTVTLTFAPQNGATDADNDNCFQGSLDRERFTWSAVETQP